VLNETLKINCWDIWKDSWKLIYQYEPMNIRSQGCLKKIWNDDNDLFGVVANAYSYGLLKLPTICLPWQWWRILFLRWRHMWDILHCCQCRMMVIGPAICGLSKKKQNFFLKHLLTSLQFNKTCLLQSIPLHCLYTAPNFSSSSGTRFVG
jgi:hypothetical protein